MKKLSLSLFLIIAAFIIVVAILLAPEQIKNVYFWVTIGWLVFLSFINWFVSTYIFLKDGKNSINPKFGILPSLNIVVFIYSIISAVFLLFTWFTNDFSITELALDYSNSTFLDNKYFYSLFFVCIERC